MMLHEENPNIEVVPALAELYQDHRKKVNQELENKPEPAPLTDEQRQRFSTNLPPCIANITTQNPDIKQDNHFNRLSMILCSCFKMAGVNEQAATETAHHFIEGYPHSQTYDTPEKRRAEWKSVWNHVQKDAKYQFNCSYIKGLGLPGSAFDCKDCALTESSVKNGVTDVIGLNDREIKAIAEQRPKVEFTSEEILKAVNDNEDGDARIFIKLYKGQYCYDHASGRWYKWNGHYWTEDLLDEITAATETLIDVYAGEAEKQSWLRLKATKEKKAEKASKCKKREDALLNRIRLLQTTNRKKNVLQLARSGRKSLGITGNEWDRPPMLLGCLNGVIDLKTGKFRPGKPQDYIKTIAPIKWVSINEIALIWDRFLEEIFNNDLNLISYIQRLLGYGITGLSIEHIIIFLWGIGRNGKGTLLEIIKFVLGALAHKTESELLLEQRFQKNAGSPNSGILSLRGKRIVWVSETSEGRRLNAGKLKEIVGGDTLNARAVYGKRHIEFTPTHLLLLLTNSKPHAPANDYALWQRIRLVPFNLSFIDNPTKENERKADKKLSEKLKAEASGILAWLVRGCLEYQKQGLNPPEIVRTATEEYRKGEDIIGHFIDDRCVISQNSQLRAGDLYKAYKTWCEEMGHKALSGIRFGKEARNRFDYDDSSNYNYYLGVQLKNDDDF